MIYVLAGNYQQFLYFCQQNKLSPNAQARYISNAEMLRGAKDIEIVYTGTLYDRNPSEIADNNRAIRIVGSKDVSELFRIT